MTICLVEGTVEAHRGHNVCQIYNPCVILMNRDGMDGSENCVIHGVYDETEEKEIHGIKLLRDIV